MILHSSLVRSRSRLLRVNQLLNCFLVGGDADFFARCDPRFSRDLLSSLPPPLIKKHQFLNQSSNPRSANSRGRINRVFHVDSSRHRSCVSVIYLTEKQIELVETFADQAVIAIENVRLFEAEQQRTQEFSESLQQQTATSEVLRVISSSPSELDPIFQAILANGARLCEANFGILALYSDSKLRVAAMHNVPHACASKCRCICSLFTFLRNCSNNLRPSGPTRFSSLSMISSGVIARSKPPASVAVSQRMTFDIATMPPKNACGYFSARTSSTFAPCLRHAHSTSAMNAADMLLIVAPPLTSTGSILPLIATSASAGSARFRGMR
jgi:hypothetical protein